MTPLDVKNMNTPDKPWVADGSESAEYEDHLIGNPEGLRILRDSLDKAIKEGHADVEGVSPWVGIKVLSKNPFVTETPQKKVREKVLAVGCTVVVIAVFALLSLGLMKLGEIIK